MPLQKLWLGEERLPRVSGQPPVVRALLVSMAAKDRSTYVHMCQVAQYTERLATWLQLPGREVEMHSLAALLHDIGKIAVPDEVLTKPGRLTDEEMAVMTHHAQWGAEVLTRVSGFDSVCDAVRYHHEWYDGRGYPTGLAGSEIPLSARLISVTDAFDTMVGSRTYREPISVEGALLELERCSGTQFDPELVRAFTTMVREAASAGQAWTQRRMQRSGAVNGAVEPLASRLAR